MHQEKTIIPIAGGKGGIGKSLLTANLAVSLAKMGHKTVVVDLDLGGSNLHTFLGLSDNHPGIGSFIHAGRKRIEEYIVTTPWKNLLFIPGDCSTPFTGNNNHNKKSLLIKNLLSIQCRYLLLDLGAGSSYNTPNLSGNIDAATDEKYVPPDELRPIDGDQTHKFSYQLNYMFQIGRAHV